MAGQNSLLRRLAGRFQRRRPPQQSEALRHEAERCGAQHIGSLRGRQSVVLVGTLNVVTINPKAGHRWLEAEIFDGTGSATLVWMGRRTLPGITPGRRLRVQGFLTMDKGRKVIYNPRYDLLPN